MCSYPHVQLSQVELSHTQAVLTGGLEPPPPPPPQALRKNNNINAANRVVGRVQYLMIDLDFMVPPPLTFKGYCLDFPLFSLTLYHQSV